MLDLSQGWAANYDLFIEIGAASSICTRLVRQSIPKKIEEAALFRRSLHYFPVLATAMFLAGLWLFPTGGIVVLHSVTIGGMSGNLRDVFCVMIDRLAGKTPAPAAKELPSGEPSKEASAAPPKTPIELEGDSGEGSNASEEKGA